MRTSEFRQGRKSFTMRRHWVPRRSDGNPENGLYTYMRYELNTSQPFIAVRSDEEGDDYSPTMGEYLCNPLDEDLIDAKVSTGGYFSAEELGVISSIPTDKDTFMVPAGGAVRFALSTWDEYTEMVLHWRVRYRTATSGFVSMSFGTFKGLADAETMPDVPGFNGQGLVVPRSVAD
jgi:hypothetical protein